MSRRISSTIISLYLALGPIIWFASFSMGGIKRILLFLVIICSVKYFSVKKIKNFPFFLLVLALISLSIYFTGTINNGDVTYFYLGIIEEFIFYVIGYYIATSNFFDRFWNINIIVLLPGIASVMTILNYLIGIPNWVAPGEEERYAELYNYGYEVRALWSTGFSWGRNGWGCTLSLLLPICLLMKKDIYKYSLWLIIMLSIFICGNRNGVFAGLLSLIIFIILGNNVRRKKLILLLISVATIFVFSIFGIGGIYSIMRLGSDDITSGRYVQYMFVPEIFDRMSFWGLGFNGTNDFFEEKGLGSHAFHNAYLNLFFQYGWPVIIALFAIIYHAIKILHQGLKSKDPIIISMSLILLSGMMLALFEPFSIFGTLGGYAIWWLSFGYLSYHKCK